ncbi:sensor histidine kinase [Actinoplanes sp. NPDC051494]|uniref:sensor histidine kinase n=1 Tax=Actinoplanes sp. NPDC051494 TaxID=3363907 RepID=UPI0037A49A6D
MTNVLRHAGPTVAEVSVVQGDDHLVVRVRDRGAGSTGEPAPGRGLSGMRRRVLAAGGTFTAGPREGGGFQVEAWLPMPEGIR